MERVSGNICDVCGTFVEGRHTIRHEQCRPPALPAGYLAARERARQQQRDRSHHAI